MGRIFMLRAFAATLISTLMWLVPLHANAEDRVVELWTCTLKDGKTLEDAKQVNAKWLKFQNDTNPGAGIRSWGLTSIVGQLGGLTYLDSFPSLDAWAKSRAASTTPAGVAVDAEFDAVVTCSETRLFQATEH
jgi:hypothetical protein